MSTTKVAHTHLTLDNANGRCQTSGVTWPTRDAAVTNLTPSLRLNKRQASQLLRKGATERDGVYISLMDCDETCHFCRLRILPDGVVSYGISFCECKSA